MAASLDRELQEIVTLNVTATDQGPGNNQANVSMKPKFLLGGWGWKGWTRFSVCVNIVEMLFARVNTMRNRNSYC